MAKKLLAVVVVQMDTHMRSLEVVLPAGTATIKLP